MRDAYPCGRSRTAGKSDAGFEICLVVRGSTPDGDVRSAFRTPERKGSVTRPSGHFPKRMEEERARRTAGSAGATQPKATRSRLEAEGIHAYLADEYMVTMDCGSYPTAVGGVKLQVAEKQCASRPGEFSHESRAGRAEMARMNTKTRTKRTKILTAADYRESRWRKPNAVSWLSSIRPGDKLIGVQVLAIASLL